MQLVPYISNPTSVLYSPHDQLPAPVPKESNYLTRHFYENTVKHLVRDTVRIMMNGLHIDMEKVVELEGVLNKQLVKVADTLANNPKVDEYLTKRYYKEIAAYKLDRQSKLDRKSVV